MSAEGKPSGGGLMGTMRTLLGAILVALHSRLDLVTLELQEERKSAVRTAVLTVLVVFLLAVAVECLLLLVLVLAWDYHCLEILLAVLVALAGLPGIYLAVQLKNLLTSRKRFMSHSLEELKKDIVGLRRVMKSSEEGK